MSEIVEKVARRPPELLSAEEREHLLADAEWLWKRLDANDIGGFRGANRPFYILHAFKEVIEKYGRRDVGLGWSKNDLDALSEPVPDQPASPSPEPDR